MHVQRLILIALIAPVARELAPIKRGDIVAVAWSHDSRIVAYDRS
jgi:hypothetical protein